MSADKAQKRFDATPARKLKAIRDGNVARSAEVAAIAAFGSAILAAFAVIPFIGQATSATLVAVAANPHAFPIDGPVTVVALALVPVCAAAAGSVAAGVAQAGGVRFNVPKWQPSRLDPVAGLKRMIGPSAAIGALRAIVTFAVAALAVWPAVLDIFARSSTVTDAAALGTLAVGAAQRACWSALAIGAAFAGVDYLLVRRRWLRELKMTFEEVRRDQKENDGDPAARARRKTLHRTLVRGSLALTKDASFVVVNPTHIAIAIRYAPPDVPVPEILVRAADAGAATVKSLARRHRIPIVENVALARALFADGEAGRAIPAPTFVAVARVIAALIHEGVLT